MYKELNQLITQTVLNSDGKEKMTKTDFSDFEGWNPNIRLFSFVQVKPGEQVDYHMHAGESETYFILSGQGVYNDNGKQIDITPGMVTFTPSGEGHFIKNTGIFIKNKIKRREIS